MTSKSMLARFFGNKTRFLLMLAAMCFLFYGCTTSEKIPNENTIVYKSDGRTVKLGDPFALAIDVSEDGQVDFTIFVELTANSRGDRLYAGMNPIGVNVIKSGPPIDENFLNMGLLVAELPNSTIDFTVGANEQWTTEFAALAIRNTLVNGDVSYEGNWADSEHIVGVQNIIDQAVYFGWLRIKFDKTTETVTLVDYAYNSRASQPILAGATSN